MTQEEVMMAFSFSLEQVLKYRKQLEQEAKVAYAQVEQERLRESNRLEQIITALNNEQHRLATLRAEDLDNRWLIANFVKSLREDLRISQEKLRYWEKKADEARQVLTEKSKDKKILEKLKEKQEIRYVHEEKRKEQQFYDELTAGKEARKS